MIARRDAEAKQAKQRTEERQAAGRPSEQAITAARNKGINPLTGMRFGVGPGDDGYDAAWYDRYKKTGYGLDEPTSKEGFDKFRHAAGELASKAMQTVGNAAGTVARGALRGFGAFAPALSAVVKGIQANPPVDPKKTKTPRS